MVRVPCCEKMGTKKGGWSPEEDEILISYIQRHGHGNWRALPKQAGLARCGKSCRLRWILNEETSPSKKTKLSLCFIKVLAIGEWSAIAASLQGRTDNVIKKYRHSHLKKKLKQSSTTKSTCLAEKTSKPPQRGIDRFQLSCVSMGNSSVLDNVDVNKDFWYKIFMENSKQAHMEISVSSEGKNLA